MRIRNKLTTVQLIMTVTLFLSLIIFSVHLSNSIKIKDTNITIHQLDSQISRFEIYIDSTMNQRTTTAIIASNLEASYIDQKDFITKLQGSGLFKGSHLREILKELRLNNVRVTTKILNTHIDTLRNITDLYTNLLVTNNGIRESIAILDRGEEEIDSSIIESLKQIHEEHMVLEETYNVYKTYWDDNKIALESSLNSAERSSVIRTVLFLIIIIFIALYLNYSITNKITKNITEVNTSLAKMTDGDFTSTLHIEAGDEFGDLARNFNQFIQQLWKKLDSMNVIMSDIGQAMNQDLDLSKIQGNILTNITNHIISDASAILNIRDGALVLSTSKGHFPPFFPVDEDLSNDRPRASRYLYNNPIPLDIEIVKECIDEKKPILVRECMKDDRFPQCRDEKSALFINSLMLVPLINAGEVLGLLVVTRSSNRKAFSDLDFNNLSSFSDYAALTIDTLDKYNDLLEKFEMQKEIGVAADIQQSLVPGKMPKVKGLSSSAYTLAAKGVSGDYYDFFRMNQYTIGATVCDVAGKGVPASLVMVMIRTILRLVASPSRGAAETLTMLNRAISGKIDVDRYATMAYFKIDLKAMKLHYSNAAHHPIQIFRQRTHQFYAVDSPGLPIGIDRDAQFNEKRIGLEPGDIIFMYTDGFPEARNHDGDEYSTSRMLREIRLHCNSDASYILDSVVTDMQKFTARANQHDDQTILIIKIDEEK